MEVLDTERCKTFEDCVAWARRRFQVGSLPWRIVTGHLASAQACCMSGLLPRDSTTYLLHGTAVVSSVAAAEWP